MYDLWLVEALVVVNVVIFSFVFNIENSFLDLTLSFFLLAQHNSVGCLYITHNDAP